MRIAVYRSSAWTEPHYTLLTLKYLYFRLSTRVPKTKQLLEMLFTLLLLELEC